jgi:hypothetical protein
VFADALLFAEFGSAEEDETVTVVVSTVPLGARGQFTKTGPPTVPGTSETVVQR